MEIIALKKGPAFAVQVKGRLDATTFGELEAKIQTWLDAHETRFLFDLSSLEYISSAGLRVFAKTIKQVVALKGQMVLCGMQEQVRKVFDIAGFTAFFTILPDAAQGLLALGNHAE